MKSLLTLSMNISEKEYRDILALDYSLISRYTNSGFNGLETIFNKIESPSLTFGSLVDCLLTAPNEVDDKFFVSELSEPSEKVKKAVEYLYNNTDKEWLGEIDADTVLNALDMVEYQSNWKDDKRIITFLDKGKNWFRFLITSAGKTIITREIYNKALNVVNVVKSSNVTKFYFEPNVEFADIQRFYQLKFKTNIDGIDFKIMPDIIVVDYYKKEITICDFKTTSKKEWDFCESFIKYNYHQQARLYYKVLFEVLKKDELFKDFKIKEFKFIVANVDNPQPIVWNCNFFMDCGDLKFGANEQILFKDPVNVGKELKKYLDEKPTKPFEIKDENDLKDFLNKIE